MSLFCAGFARVQITPPLGMPLAGYYHLRIADTVLDELEATAMALECGRETLLVVSLDLLELLSSDSLAVRSAIAESTHLPMDHIFLACTHTHTGPKVSGDERPEMQKDYLRFLISRMRDLACFALRDMRPARMYTATGHAPDIAFNRRYRMKDGSFETNPGVRNPDILSPAGEADDRVSLVRIDRENAETLLLVHFSCHPDTIGGNNISADWPGFARRTLEKALDNTRCMVLNGALGDVNHIKVFPEEGDLNDMHMDFDHVYRGYSHARHMGMTIAGAVLQRLGKMRPAVSPRVFCLQKNIYCPSSRPKPEDIPLARRIVKLHLEGRDRELRYSGMQLTTVVAEAERMLQLEHGPDGFELCLTAAAFGPVALMGIPGEPFCATGKEIRAKSPFALTLPCCCVNGYENYFPTLSSYEEGGYEARSSLFAAGVAERILGEALDMLRAVRAEQKEGKA